MALYVFRESKIVKFLLRGLVRGGVREGGELRLPERGSIANEEIDDISKSRLRFP